MNTSSLKTFAQNARNKLRAQVAARLNYWVGAEGGTAPDTAAHRQFAPQLRELRSQMAREGREGIVERVSYLWFNRLAALRFMDANDFHPFGVRVVSPARENEILPALLQQARAGAMPAEIRAKLANPQSFDDILAGRIPVAHPETELFGMLLLAACNYYHDVMPFLFEELGDATQLLLPEDLLSGQSILTDIRENLTADNCREVEVIGWLYQFYISEKKAEVDARESTVPSEDIPAVTQLFTPHWIVRYLVENSLGRLWLLNRPHSRLREHMPYYIESGTDSSSEASAKEDFLRIASPEEIKLLDPACGSAHMLTYAFDLLYLIYEEEGYEAKDIPSLILRHNLHGTEICERAAALAAFALCMKARAKDRRFFKRLTDGGEDAPKPRITELQDVRYEENELAEYIAASGLNYYFKKTVREWVLDGSLLSRQSHFDAESIAVTLLDLLEEKRLLLPRLESFELDPKVAKALVKHLKTGKKVSEMPARQLRTLRDAAFLSMVQSREILDFSDELDLGNLAKQVHLKLFRQFEQAKNFGSLIQPCLTEAEIQSARSEITHLESEIFGDDSDLMVAATHRKILRALDQSEALTQRYQIVVANPPYLDLGNMNPSLKAFVEKNFEETKQGLDSCFIARCLSLSLQGGRSGMITQRSWMFLSRLADFRHKLLENTLLESMLYLGPRTFPEITGEKVQNSAFVFLNQKRDPNARSVFFRLTYYKGEDKHLAFLRREHKYVVNVSDLKDLPGWPVAFWASKQLRNAFAAGKTLDDVAEPRVGLDTGDNPSFIRLWHEVGVGSVLFDANSTSAFHASMRRWAPHSKGGHYRRWFGNLQEIIAFSQNDFEILSNQGNRLPSRQYYFKKGMFYTRVSSEPFSLRLSPPGVIFNSASPTIFPELGFENTVFGLLNSKVVNAILECLSPTLNYQAGELRKIPLPEEHLEESARGLIDGCVSLAQGDWNNFETSWDFRDLPLLRPGNWEVEPGQPGCPWKGSTLAESWTNYATHCTTAIRRMQELETDNNRLWIDAYGLEGELVPEVPEDRITLARADRGTDMAAFISYAVGCMMGRYSLDELGLILANAGDTLEDFRAKVSTPTFLPDDDAIIPVLDGEWFTDDIVGRFREFLRVTFGDASFTANLRFIEESLGSVDPKSGKVKPTDLRSYFVGDFYKKHLSNERAYGYKKRPIYWMVSSPNSSFQALIYLHRYTRDTMNHLLDRYVRPFIDKLEQRQQACTVISTDAAAKPSDHTAAQKELIQLAKMLKEIREWERESLLPIAQQRIELDLDDGVKVNYLKFKGVLVPIPGLEKKEED